MKKETKSVLWSIFIIILIIRLVLAFTTPNLTYESYFHLKQIEHISETGVPLYQDSLSYGGRSQVFLPLFHYLLAFFSLFLPLGLVAKIVPNLLIATLPLIIFQISKRITKNERASLLSAVIAGLLPIHYFTNALTSTALFLPLLFLAIYSFLNLKKKKFLYLYAGSFLFMSLTSSATLLLLMGFGIYILLSFIEGRKMDRAEAELILFSVLFYFWIQFLFFKNVLIESGISIIWQNIPPQIVAQYFPKIPILEAILLVSIIPFMAGIYVAYRSLFQLKGVKGQKNFLLISLVISTTILTWLRLIEFKVSLAFFGLVLAILFATFYQETMNYFQHTKSKQLKKYFFLIIGTLLILSMIFPAINVSLDQKTPFENDLEAFQWLEKNVPKKEGVIALLEEGHLVTYYGKRENFMDDQFSMIDNIEKRFADLNSLFTTKFQTHAISLLDEYDYKYLMFTPLAQEKYGIERFDYIKGKCFDKIYDNETKIYLARCTLNEEN